MIGQLGFAAGRSAGEYFGALNPPPAPPSWYDPSKNHGTQPWMEAGATPSQASGYATPTEWTVSALDISDGASQRAATKYVQLFLYRFGLLDANEIDGVFGPQTQKALKVVQSLIGVTPNGVYGQYTHDYLWNWGYKTNWKYTDLSRGAKKSSSSSSSSSRGSDAPPTPSSSRGSSSSSSGGSSAPPAPPAAASLAPVQAPATSSLVAYGILGIGALVAAVALSSLLRKD